MDEVTVSENSVDLKNYDNRCAQKTILETNVEAQLEQYFDKAKITPESRIEREVFTILAERFDNAESFGLPEVALDMGISLRTLQRRLSDNNTSYTRIRDIFRQHHALYMVLFSNRSTSYIATVLGFEQRTTFFRVFHRWTGFSPMKFRLIFKNYRHAITGGPTHY